MINSKIFWCGRLGELGELAVISDGRRLLCSAATHPPPKVSTTNYYIMFGFFVFIALDSLHSLEPSIPSTVRLTSDPTFRSLLSLLPSALVLRLFFSLSPPPPFTLFSLPFLLFPFFSYYISRIYELSFFFSPITRFHIYSSTRHCLSQFRVSFEEKGKLIRQSITSYGVPVASTLP